MFIGLLRSIVSASKYAKSVSLNNQKSMTQHTLIDLHHYNYSQGLLPICSWFRHMCWKLQYS